MDVELIELPGRCSLPTSKAAVFRSVSTAADDVGPVSDESVSVEDVITPEDEAELEEVGEDENEAEPA